VVFVCNDWHTGPLSCYLKTNYHPNGIYRDAKVSSPCFREKVSIFSCVHSETNRLRLESTQVAFCIHNISYQGRFALADFGGLNLPNRFKSSFDFLDGYAH
jgi:granule-bound starch synthase